MKRITRLALFAMLAVLFIFPMSIEAAGLNKTKATVKAGAPVILELKDASGKKLEWSISAGQMLYRISKASDDLPAETRIWNGKTFKVYDTGTAEYKLITPAGCGAKIAAVAVKNCKVTVKDTGTGKSYSCAITVTPQKIAKADVLAVNNMKMDGKNFLRLSYAFAYPDGNRAAFNGTIKVTIRDSKKSTVYAKTCTISQRSTEYDAFYYDGKGAVCVLPLNEYGTGIKKGSSSTGTATIVAQETGKTALKAVTCKVTGLPVRKDATQITLVKSAKATVGYTKGLFPKLVVKGETLTGLKWSSSNTKIATVSSKGVVTGKKVGSCDIYCTLSNGKKYTVKMTIRDNKHNTGKTVTNCFVNDYNYGYVSLELASIYVKDGKLYTKWVALNNTIYTAAKFDYIDVDLTDGKGKSFANRRFTNITAGIRSKDKKYITLVFPAGSFRKVDLPREDFKWQYYTYCTYK